MKNSLIMAGLLGLAGSIGAAPELPTIPPGVFNVAKYGAIGDGVTTNTAAIQAAVNALDAAGGGTLEVPPGIFLSGPLLLNSNTRFKLDAGATLLLLPYGSYPGGEKPPSFITVQDGAHDIEFCGPGMIDGQGAPWWAAKLGAEAHRPYEIHLSNCHRLFVHDWNSRNPPRKHLVIDGFSDNITVQNCTHSAPYPSPNTDCINLQGTHCLIQNCNFRGGDDNIAIGRSSGPCADTLISNITCGTGHGISLGSITSRGISNVTVVDCTMSGTDFGIRLKAGRDRGGLVRNITFRNISMTNVRDAIAIYSYYNELSPLHTTPAEAAKSKVQPVVRLTPIWRDITISNVTATGGALAGIIWGRPEMLASNVTLDHVNITATKTFDIYNARGIHLVDSHFTVEKGSGLALYNAQVEIRNHEPVTSVGSMDFALGANSSTVKVEGNPSFSGVLNISDGGGFKAGAYTLFAFNGVWTGQPKIGATPAGYHCRFDTSTPGQGRLVVSRDP